MSIPDWSGFEQMFHAMLAHQHFDTKEHEPYTEEMNMIKRTITETTIEYDKEGKIIRKTITETTEDDNTNYYPQFPYVTYTKQDTATDPLTYRTDVTCSCARGEGACHE